MPGVADAADDARGRHSRSRRVSSRPERDAPPAGPRQPAVLQFFVRDPWKDRPVTQLQRRPREALSCVRRQPGSGVLRTRHPGLVADGMFQYPITFPKAGMYRVLGDFYPAGATPQLTTADPHRAGGRRPRAASTATTRTRPAELRVSLVDDSRAADSRHPHADALHRGPLDGLASVPWRMGATCWPRATI